MLATDWTWALFDRAVCAHMRGDDRLALLDARALARIEKTIEAEGDRRGFHDKLAPGAKKESLLGFLAPLPSLLADQERRNRNKPEPAQPKEKDRSRRIAGLIRQLENVSARQWGQPGGVDLGGDGTVQAFIQEGDAAIEPLLKCLEEDQRLTRSVHFHRDFFRHRSILGVHEAAYVALVGILQTSFFGVASTGDDLTARGAEGRKKVAAAIREYWNRFKGLPLTERWYRILADDKASIGQWLQAASNIVQPEDVSVTRGSMFGTGWVTVPNRKKGAKPTVRGEVLRKKTDPSVTELLTRRIEQIRRSGAPGSERMYRLGDACRMTDQLAAWDPRGGLPVLRKQMKLCRDYLASDEGRNNNAYALLGPAIARFTQTRLQLGDRPALDEYADWIQTVGPTNASHSFLDVLRPFWENPTHPSLVAAAEKMFAERSAWTERFLLAFNTRDLASTPMVGVAGFRKRLLVELADTRPAGKVKFDKEGIGFLEVTDGWSGGAAIHTVGDPLAPKGATEVAFRICDYYTWSLSDLEGAPRCELYWPVSDRDKAVAACAAFLKQYGERFQFSRDVEIPERDTSPWPNSNKARLAFPLRDRPATAEEVRTGQAIFSLAGEEKVRKSKLSALPIRARWLAWKGAMRVAQGWDSRRERAIYHREPDQDGVVWQAEEVFRDGRWERYYGFVGRHVIAKVPASEVEFPAGDGWARLSDGIDCQVIAPGVKKTEDRITVTLLGVGNPLVVRVRLRNRSGQDQVMPAAFVRQEAGRPLALHSGVELRLQVNGPAESGSRWSEVPSRRVQPLVPGKAHRKAEPTEEFAEFAVDLRNAFDISRPGSYKLHLRFDKGAGAFATGKSLEVEFELVETLPRPREDSTP
jgi:hypothetical protein